jgi:hypothetical protein
VILVKSGYRGYKVERILPVGREKKYFKLIATLLKKVVTEVTVVTKLGEITDREKKILK